MLPTESPLLASAREGNRDALAALFRQHDSALRAAIQKRLPQRWQALLSVEDVVQQTYIDAMLAIHRFTPLNERSFGAWVRKLAEHNLIEVVRSLETKKRGGDAHRLNSGRPTDWLETLFEQLTCGLTFNTPSRHVARTDRDRLLNQAIERLPEDYRRIVREYDLADRPMDEIAADLGRSVGAVHLMRVRALARLRLVLGGNLTDFQSLP